MTTLTRQHLKLNKHIKYNSGSTKTVCVSTCLSFFGINPNQYNYTSSRKNRQAYKNVLRRFGYSVRSRKSAFKVKAGMTMTQLRTNIKKSEYTKADKFIVCGYQSKSAHLMVLNGEGDIIIDTAPKKRWKIEQVDIVE